MAAVEVAVLRCRVSFQGRAEHTGIPTGLEMGKSGSRSGKLEEWTFPRLGCEGQGRGLVTCPLISQHCQNSRLRCQRYWIRGWGSAEGGAGNAEAEVDNVQIEMLFKILNKWCAPWVWINQGKWQKPGRPALCGHGAAPAHTGVGWGFCSFLGYSQRLQIGYKLRVEAKNSSSSLNPKALTFLHSLMMHFLFLGRVQISCIIIILRPSPILKPLAFKYIITLSPGPSIFHSVLQKWGVCFFLPHLWKPSLCR